LHCSGDERADDVRAWSWRFATSFAASTEAPELRATFEALGRGSRRRNAYRTLESHYREVESQANRDERVFFVRMWIEPQDVAWRGSV